MTHLLDTSAYAAFRRGDSRILTIIRDSSRLFLPSIVIGELLYGFRVGSRFQANTEHLQAFLHSGHVEALSVTPTTADHYSRIAESLRRSGQPIPTNDLWIAALAAEHDVTIVTYDQHFKRVDGVRVQCLTLPA